MGTDRSMSRKLQGFQGKTGGIDDEKDGGLAPDDHSVGLLCSGCAGVQLFG